MPTIQLSKKHVLSRRSLFFFLDGQVPEWKRFVTFVKPFNTNLKNIHTLRA